MRSGEVVCGLCSGGMDSSLMLVLLREMGFGVLPCYIDYGQRVKERELAVLEQFCTTYEFELPRVFAIPMHDVFRGIWSISGDDVPERSEDIVRKYIPARNILFIVKLAAFMQLNDLKRLALGAQCTDSMPDNNRAFFDEMERVLALGMSVPSKEFCMEILAPVASMSKAEIAAGLVERDVDPALTWSCYGHGLDHCGVCWQCSERAEAFANAGLSDPTVYASVVAGLG